MLNEAIADAKAVKETAIANAKAALEEAFTPHLKSMLAAKLEEMDKDEEVEENVELDEMDDVSFRRKNSPSYNADPEGGPVNPVPHKVGKTTVQEEEEIEEEDLDLDEILNELDLSEEDKDEMNEVEDEDVEDENMEDEEMEEEEIDLEDMSEDDLKSFIEDVIKDMVESGELEAGEEMESEDEESEVDMDIEVEDDMEDIMEIKEDMYKPGSIAPTDLYYSDKHGKLVAMDDVDDKYHDSLELVYSKGDKIEGPMYEEEVEEAFTTGTGAGEGMSDNALRDLAAKFGKDVADYVKKNFAMGSMSKAMASESELEEALETINSLKTELQEVNLLNAKLLYTNKIFKSKNLTEDKKVRVLKAFDKAETVKEAKVIFETLNEGIENKISKPSINENVRKGMASKVTQVVTENKKPIIEVDPMVARWQKLAGLTND